jgi:signal transduction histidine kinase
VDLVTHDRAAGEEVAEEEQMDFGTVLRHELNNPLTGILGNAELLLAEVRRKNLELPEQARIRLETIAELAVRSSFLPSGSLNRSILFNASGVAGGMGEELQHAPLELRRLVTERGGVKRARHDPHGFWSTRGGENFFRVAAWQSGVGGIANQ